MPKRIQRKRTKGWRMPEGAVYVGRPTKWGNPFRVGAAHPHSGEPMTPVTCAALYQLAMEAAVSVWEGGHPSLYHQDQSDIYDAWKAVAGDPIWAVGLGIDLCNLRGRDLACWCGLDQDCHADVLLDLANR